MSKRQNAMNNDIRRKASVTIPATESVTKLCMIHTKDEMVAHMRITRVLPKQNAKVTKITAEVVVRV